MRVEEMYYIVAEAMAMAGRVDEARSYLLSFVNEHRDPAYTIPAGVSPAQLRDMIWLQRRIEFWGEGINYFDAKRLEVGIHRAYKGSNCERYQHCIDMDGAYVGWTPGWNQAELNANPAIFHYNNPYTNPTTYYVFKSNDELRSYYGTEITE